MKKRTKEQLNRIQEDNNLLDRARSKPKNISVPRSRRVSFLNDIQGDPFSVIMGVLACEMATIKRIKRGE